MRSLIVKYWPAFNGLYFVLTCSLVGDQWGSRPHFIVTAGSFLTPWLVLVLCPCRRCEERAGEKEKEKMMWFVEALIGSRVIDQCAKRDGRGWARLIVWQRWTPVGLAAGGRVTLSSGLVLTLMLLAGVTPGNHYDHPSEYVSPALCPFII